MKLSDNITGNARIAVAIFLFVGLLCSLWLIWSLLETQFLDSLNTTTNGLGTIGVVLIIAITAMTLFRSLRKRK